MECSKERGAPCSAVTQRWFAGKNGGVRQAPAPAAERTPIERKNSPQLPPVSDRPTAVEQDAGACSRADTPERKRTN